MGAALLTTASVLMCPHGGSVSIITSNTQATAGGSPLVRTSDTFIIAGCPFTLPGPVPSPCVSVQWMQADTRSQAGGRLHVELGQRRHVPRRDASAAGVRAHQHDTATGDGSVA
jgi:hypothetical protein